VDDVFPKLATASGGKHVIRDNPPLIFHPVASEKTQANTQHFMEAFQQYRSTLVDDRKVLLDQYELKDVALKVVGVGSVGTRCGIIS
jgi:hypothetical protein